MGEPRFSKRRRSLTMKSKLLLPALLLSMGFLTACAGGYSAHYVAVGPPPPPAYGVVGVAPGPGYVWVDGFWDLRGGRWMWSRGYWVRPPRRGAIWVAPAWRPYDRGYRFHR